MGLKISNIDHARMVSSSRSTMSFHLPVMIPRNFVYNCWVLAVMVGVNDWVHYRSGQSWDATWTGSGTKLEVKSKRCLGVSAKMYVITTVLLPG